MSFKGRAETWIGFDALMKRMVQAFFAIAFALAACNSDTPPAVPAAEVAKPARLAQPGTGAAAVETAEAEPAGSAESGARAPIEDAAPAAPGKAAEKAGPSGARALAIARACAEAEPYDGRGIGGNALVYAEMTWSQPPAASRASDYVFYVFIPEEPPRTQVPNGLALSVDTLRERCGRAAMD